jgi:hypothetical protein
MPVIGLSEASIGLVGRIEIDGRAVDQRRPIAALPHGLRSGLNATLGYPLLC